MSPEKETIDYSSLEKQIRTIQKAGKTGLIEIGDKFNLEFVPFQNPASLIERIKKYCQEYKTESVSIYTKD